MSGGSGTVLDRIAASVRDRLAREAPPPGLEAAAREAARRRREHGGRSLLATLAAPGVRVIAECKRRSPSAGWLRDGFEPVSLARAYRQGGAAAVSVVTEPEYFAGRASWIAPIKEAVDLPVLQKDFIVDERQLFEAILAGADAVLLIARLLPAARLAEFVRAAEELALEPLVEVHDEADLERAGTVGARLVGINARDLATFRVDLGRALELSARVPDGALVVIESGIDGCAAARPFLERGLRCFLVGEHLLRAADPAAAVARLVACR